MPLLQVRDDFALYVSYKWFTILSSYVIGEASFWLRHSALAYVYYLVVVLSLSVSPVCSEALGEWSGSSGSPPLCNLVRETTDFIECRCRHLSTFGVRAVVDDSGIADYGVPFYICIAITLVIKLLAQPVLEIS